MPEIETINDPLFDKAELIFVEVEAVCDEGTV